MGVNGAHKKRNRDKDGKGEGPRELIDSLAKIVWQGRPVYICFDSDAATNKSVCTAEWHLAETLTAQAPLFALFVYQKERRDRTASLAKLGLMIFFLLAVQPRSANY